MSGITIDIARGRGDKAMTRYNLTGNVFDATVEAGRVTVRPKDGTDQRLIAAAMQTINSLERHRRLLIDEASHADPDGVLAQAIADHFSLTVVRASEPNPDEAERVYYC